MNQNTQRFREDHPHIVICTAGNSRPVELKQTKFFTENDNDEIWEEGQLNLTNIGVYVDLQIAYASSASWVHGIHSL